MKLPEKLTPVDWQMKMTEKLTPISHHAKAGVTKRRHCDCTVPCSDTISEVVLNVTVKFSSASFSSHNATIFSWPLTWFSQWSDSVTVTKLHKASWWPCIAINWCLTRSVCFFFVASITLSQSVFQLSTATSTKMRSCSTCNKHRHMNHVQLIKL